MNILIIGSGGREHALAWKIAKSPRVKHLYCAPGSDGIAEAATCVPVPVDDIEALLNLARQKNIDLTVVGPELPLSLGIVDRFESEGLRIFGPSKDAAQLETSKIFSKELMKKYGIPTARAEFPTFKEAQERLTAFKLPVVLKIDGLAGGKGVIIAHSLEEAKAGLAELELKGQASDRILIEEFLEGDEVSFFAVSDGHSAIAIGSAQDHKRVFDNDRGPNTGGMGVFAPSPLVDEQREEQIMQEVILPTLKAMEQEGMPYRGILYAGLILHGDDIHVLEFNARWGDPEAQAMLLRMNTDWVDVMEAALLGTLETCSIDWAPTRSVCVVLSSEGYPGNYRSGDEITGLDARIDQNKEASIFHAGTTSERSGSWITKGGRVLSVAAQGDTFREARAKTYAKIDSIRFKGRHFRKDIALKVSLT